MTYPLIDIGVNLTHRQFRSDHEEVLQRAIDAGVETLILTGTSLRSSQEALTYAKRHPKHLFSTVGIHPHDAKEFQKNKTFEELKKLASDKAAVAIGECGLDFNRDFSPRPKQEECFVAQLELACELEMPVFLHERDACERFSAILSEYRPRLVDAVVHCFTGSEEALKRYLDMDTYIGITGWICDERRGAHLRKLVKMIPRNRLLLETDAPFLLPRDMKPKPKKRRNEPSFLPHILRTVAACLDSSPEQLAKETTANARSFFRLDEAA